MESLAIIQFNARHFPPDFLACPKVHFLILSRKSYIWRTAGHHRISASASNETNRSVVSVKDKLKSGQECVGLEIQQGWIHFVGVGGCGLSALAMLSLKQGYEVSGSDIEWTSFMDRLQKAGANLHIGHSASNMQKNGTHSLPDAIVVSSAIPQHNVEIFFANSVGVPVYKRGSWLGKITNRYDLIAISGTHGKSSTTSMLAYVLKELGDDLTALVGACVPQFSDSNIISGGGPNFVLEADEYDGCFLELSPYIAVITSLEWEHVDIFPTEEAVKTMFRRFLNKIRVGGTLILCGDSPGACSLLEHKRGRSSSEDSSPEISITCGGDGYRIITYGILSNNEWQASSIHTNPLGGSNYTLCHRGRPVADISLRIPGDHNILNSLAVIIAAVELFRDRKPFDEIINRMRLHLNNFIGVSRRFEKIGTICGCHIYDDYAHHPTEVRAVLQAARQKFPSKALLVVFQPHTHSRLAALKEEFAKALSEANQVVVTAVYAARQSDVWNVSGKDLAFSIVGPPSEYIPSLGDVVNQLALQISSDPHRAIVVLTVGAGDVTTVGLNLLHNLRQRLEKSNTLHT